MSELFESFSLSEIILFVVLIAAAVKGIVQFYDWGYNRLKDMFSKEHNAEEQQVEVDKRFKDVDEKIKELQENQSSILVTLNKLDQKVDMLIDSDMDDIKSYLTREHHYYCYVKKWIDDYSLECCERRFKHYEDEGGNSFIRGFMTELRALPKRPPYPGMSVGDPSHYATTLELSSLPISDNEA